MKHNRRVGIYGSTRGKSDLLFLFISGLALQTYTARERARERERKRKRKRERKREREREREKEREREREKERDLALRVVMNDAGLFLALPDEKSGEGVPTSLLIFSLLAKIRETESRRERERARQRARAGMSEVPLYMHAYHLWSASWSSPLTPLRPSASTV